MTVLALAVLIPTTYMSMRDACNSLDDLLNFETGDLQLLRARVLGPVQMGSR